MYDTGNASLAASTGQQTFMRLVGGLFLLFGIGSGITYWLGATLAPEDSGFGGLMSPSTISFGSGDELFVAMFMGFSMLLMFAPFLGLVFGILGGRTIQGLRTDVARVAGISIGVGFVAAIAVQLVLLVVLSPSGSFENVGDLVGPVLGMGIGTALTGSVAAHLTADV
jgi:hypothetical protein